ncbi:hypothetical protein WJX84_006375, partial [Apatococcus fuscideae]
GKNEEVSLEDLLCITKERLKHLTTAGPLTSAEGTIQGPEPVEFSARMDGLLGHVAGHAKLSKDESGKPTAVVAIAMAESFPDGLLHDAKLHWGTCLHEESGWERAPKGWKAFPEGSHEAGGVATETPFERVDLPDGSSNAHSAAYAATVQLPLDSGMVGALSFVIHAPGGRWVACNQANSRQDFFFSLSPLMKAVRKEQKENAAKKNRKSPAASSKSEGLPADSSEIEGAPAAPDQDLSREGGLGSSNWRGAPNHDFIHSLAAQEPKAERSLMHRFNTGQDMLERALALPSEEERQGGLAALVVWLRFSAARLLTWNRNYNIKPREISAAQERLTRSLVETLETKPELHDLVMLAMGAVGRGGEGNEGQRIRDEILTVQSRNHAKGGMMEEWHQKLHNNSSPDDIIICQALLAYLHSDLDITQYWATLSAGNVTKERMAGYDRAIRSEPRFEPSQKAGLIRDLTAYLRTLQAVHGGSDLRSAAATVLGFQREARKGRAVAVEPVPNVATPGLRRLLDLCTSQQSSSETSMDSTDQAGQALRSVKLMVDARLQLVPVIKAGNSACGNRLRDVLYLDLALEGTVRTIIEAHMAFIRQIAQSPEGLSQLALLTTWALQQACLSFGSTQELDLILKGFQAAARRGMQDRGGQMRAYAAAERLSRALGDISQVFLECLRPTAEALGSKLGIPQETCLLFPEEVVRGTMAAPLSQLLAILDTALSLAAVQHQSFQQPTLLIARHVNGEEEVPLGVVGVVTGDQPDALCHAAVRARCAGIPMACCLEAAQLDSMRSLQGRLMTLHISQDGQTVSMLPAEQPPGAAASLPERKAALPSLSAPTWMGRYAIPAQDFGAGQVGAKSMNLSQLKGHLPDWIHLPASAALPFGTFEAALGDSRNAEAAAEIHRLQQQLQGNGTVLSDSLGAVRAAVLRLVAPAELLPQLEQALQDAGLPRLERKQQQAAWQAIKRVWASQWNDRAVVSMRRAGLDPAGLRMAVLCQATLPARYAFVSHTSNPLTGDPTEIYAEVVQGLGETLVGNFPGSAFSFVASKDQLPSSSDDPIGLKASSLAESGITIMGFPSKSFAMQPPGSNKDGSSFIFRSDSNGEDLEGFAGAGLFDSVQMSHPELVAADYSHDALFEEDEVQSHICLKIAQASRLVAEHFGPGQHQDIEGVLTSDQRVWIVQTRPQA